MCITGPLRAATHHLVENNPLKKTWRAAQKILFMRKRAWRSEEIVRHCGFSVVASASCPHIHWLRKKKICLVWKQMRVFQDESVKFFRLEKQKTLINLVDTSALWSKYYLSSRPERWRTANALFSGKFLQKSAAAHFPPSVKDAGNLTPQLCFWKAKSIEITCSGSRCSSRSSLFWKLTGPRCFWPDSWLQWNTHIVVFRFSLLPWRQH